MILIAIIILFCFVGLWVIATWLLGWAGFVSFLIVLALGWAVERFFTGSGKCDHDPTLNAFQQPLSRRKKHM